ncbi:MAG TPA: hypothetical protein VGD47_01680, partial [Steroidobacteraceae bacterium]
MRRDAALMLARQITFIRQLSLQACPLIRGEILRVPECNLIVRCRFTMCANRRGLRGGDGRETQDLLCNARAIRVMCKARGRDTGPVRQNREHSRVQTLLARLRKRIFERPPGKLVPEGESAVLVAYHADAQATFDARFIRPGGWLQQPGFSLSG